MDFAPAISAKPSIFTRIYFSIGIVPGVPMSTSAFFLVQLVHVVSATLWVGGAVVVAGFVAPAIRAAGPAGGPVMRQLTEVRRLPSVLAGAGVIVARGTRVAAILLMVATSAMATSAKPRVATSSLDAKPDR
jgi:hypothetical protein